MQALLIQIPEPERAQVRAEKERSWTWASAKTRPEADTKRVESPCKSLPQHRRPTPHPPRTAAATRKVLDCRRCPGASPSGPVASVSSHSSSNSAERFANDSSVNEDFGMEPIPRANAIEPTSFRTEVNHVAISPRISYSTERRKSADSCQLCSHLPSASRWSLALSKARPNVCPTTRSTSMRCVLTTIYRAPSSNAQVIWCSRAARNTVAPTLADWQSILKSVPENRHRNSSMTRSVSGANGKMLAP